MLKDFLDKVQWDSAPESFVENDTLFVKKASGYDHVALKTNEPIKVTKLASFVKATALLMADQQAQQNHLVRVESPTSVVLVPKELDGSFSRDVLVRAFWQYDNPFKFGTFHDQETFLITLQQGFVKDIERDAIAQLCGTLGRQKTLTSNDDGMTQEVTASDRSGLLTRVEFKNPALLKPFRTFKDIEQPESPFLLRFSGGCETQVPKIALFDIDEAAWQIEARDSIAQYIIDEFAKLSLNVPVLV